MHSKVMRYLVYGANAQKFYKILILKSHSKQNIGMNKTVQRTTLQRRNLVQALFQAR